MSKPAEIAGKATYTRLMFKCLGLGVNACGLHFVVLTWHKAKWLERIADGHTIYCPECGNTQSYFLGAETKEGFILDVCSSHTAGVDKDITDLSAASSKLTASVK